MIHISRNPERKTCYRIMIVFGKNKSYLDYDPSVDPTMTLLRQNIGDMARFYGKDWDEYVDRFEKHYKKIVKLSERVNKKLSNILDNREVDLPEDLDFYYGNHGGFFTLHEIAFFDWYTNKHKFGHQNEIRN